MKRMIVAVVFVGFVGYLSLPTLLTTLLFAASVAVNPLVRSAAKKEGFEWAVVFHKGCATIHWAFVSYYVFAFDNLRSDLGRFRPVYVLIFVLLLSCFMYVVGGLKTEQVLSSTNEM